MKPYLSIVATSRNDNHGGDLLRRMQIFVSALLQQAERHAVDCELIIVEWNPPADRPPLAEALKWPAKPGRCAVRIITVPTKRHLRLRHSDRLPLFQMIAKNVGIRRAAGEFVLATNIDLLFNDELMRHIAARRLPPDRMIRIDRHDADSGVPDGEPVERQLEYCRNHLLRINRRLGSFNVVNGRVSKVHHPLGWPERFAEAVWETVRPARLTRPARLHTNACGDFTLLSAERWAATRAYPELEVFSMHIDSLFCYQAHHSGTPELVLGEPMRIYHIEHAKGSGFTPEGVGALYRRIDGAGIARLESAQIYDWALHMRRNRQAVTFNDSGWGFAGEDLPETRIGTVPTVPAAASAPAAR